MPCGGDALSHLGIAATVLGDMSHATACYEAACTIAREIGDRRLEGQTLGALAWASAHQGDLLRAAAICAQACALLQERG